jgi:hypothetical protein
MKVSIDNVYTSNGGKISVLCTDIPNDDNLVVGMKENGDMLFFNRYGICLSDQDYNL